MTSGLIIVIGVTWSAANKIKNANNEILFPPKQK
jgi:hypothetical protein